MKHINQLCEGDADRSGPFLENVKNTNGMRKPDGLISVGPLANNMSDATVILAAVKAGDSKAAEALLMIARAIDGQPEGLSKDDILDNITLYWVTNKAVSSARLYWDASATAKKGFFDIKGVVSVPFAVSAFPGARGIRQCCY